MRILVTGAGGYIGRHLVPRLKAQGHEVIGAYHQHGEHQPPSMLLDCDDAAEMACLVETAAEEGSPDTVIHLAGRVDINLLPNPKGAHLPPVPGPCDIGALYRDNVLGTANVLDYCLRAGVKHLIFASTQAVYGMGSPDDGELNEEPLEHYAASKVAAEQLVRMGREQGIVTSILRLPGIFGGDRKDGAVYSMCRDALQKGEIRVTHPYPLPVNVIHIDDVVGALAAAAAWQPPKRGWEPVWWGDGLELDISGQSEGCSLDILADEIAGLVLGCKVGHGVNKHPELIVDGERAQYVLNWHPKPRKERLAQVLEEIRRESGRSVP